MRPRDRGGRVALASRLGAWHAAARLGRRAKLGPCAVSGAEFVGEEVERPEGIMVENESREPGLVKRLERGPCGLPRAQAEAAWGELMPPGWEGRMSELSGEALRALWAEAVGYARWEIGQYGRWRELKEPVLADGYDAEGVVQAAFERLLYREVESIPILHSAEALRRELRVLIKHRVRWLHERSETRLVVGEWDVMAARPDGELVSIFDSMPGRLERPDEALMRKEKEQLLGEFKAGFEGTIKKGRQDLLEVFRGVWDGRKRREIAQGGRAEEIRKRSECRNGRGEKGDGWGRGSGQAGSPNQPQRRNDGGAGREVPHDLTRTSSQPASQSGESRLKAECRMQNAECGVPTERVKALDAQLRRRLARFGAGARGGVAEMLEGVKEGG